MFTVIYASPLCYNNNVKKSFGWDFVLIVQLQLPTMNTELQRALQNELVQFDARDITMYQSDETVQRYTNMVTWSLLQIVRRTKELQNEELDAFSKQLARECLENTDGAAHGTGMLASSPGTEPPEYFYTKKTSAYVTNVEQANPALETKKRKRDYDAFQESCRNTCRQCVRP